MILALETATRAVSAAVLRGEELLCEARADRGRPAAECLLPAVDAALVGAGCGLDAIEAIAVSVGPGSFTGLRIGVATAKGLAFGNACRVVPVSTLEALAWAEWEDGRPVVAMLDAQRGEVYAGAWSFDGGASADARRLCPEGVYTAEELAGRLPERCRLVGEGVAIAGDELRRRLGAGVTFAPSGVGPAAGRVGRLGARILRAGGACDASSLAPRYLRRAEAEVKRTGVRFEPPNGPA